MLNSKWQMQRIGLIDFWYYDDEEFYFLDGRMLLRGSNGSGKSVTMQSFIPLLLDGNMRPERLDPFGSRARKMENYLLEEGDEREERTGYLFLECKRTDGENYLTIGIGLRARRNKKLETWYFYIQDGRRVGKDIFLYKNVGSKIAYTKQELKNQIGEGGRLMESQTEYMESINRLLFGFDTIDQYKELLELLLQLRTPKLSKDFKPTFINEILSSSLQTLSEDDLRPMSEAIENMDVLKTNLNSLKDSVQAAKQIEKVYSSYNQILLYQKANYLTGAVRQKKSFDETAKEYSVRVLSLEQSLENEKEQYAALSQEEEILKKERESLAESDAAKLKEQEHELNQAMQEEEEQIQKKEAQETEKEEKQKEISNEVKKQKERNEEKYNDIKQNLEEMEEQIKDIPFDEFDFMKREILQSPEENYDFKTHVKILHDYMMLVEDGIEILNQENLSRERYDGQLRQVDELRQERDQNERETVQYQNQLQEVKGELIEAIYQWSKENKELMLSNEVLQNSSRIIEEFNEQSDYSELREAVRIQKNRQEDVLRRLHADVVRLEQDIEEARKQKKEELVKWETMKDPEPEISEAVKKNRELLRKKNIPFQQFYKTVEFDKSLNQEQESRLEEALYSMGILDALIIPSEFREQVLNLDKGVCDRYIFSDVSYVKKNLSVRLDVDNPKNDIIRYQNVSTILSSIGYQRQDTLTSTWINEDGVYCLGILEGNVTGDYKACYIGGRVREEYRIRTVERLQQEYELLCKEKDEKEQDNLFLTKRIDELEQEWRKFPESEDLRASVREYGRCMEALERTGKHLHIAQGKLHEAEIQLTQIRCQVQEICSKTYLTVRLDNFLKAKQSLQEYKDTMTELQIVAASYVTGILVLKNCLDQIEELDADLDDIRYELLRLRRTFEERRKKIQSVKEQLTLTNYEEIKERLDHCIRRLAMIPKQREASVAEQTSLEENIKNTRRETETNAVKQLEEKNRILVFYRAFEAEYRLGYVERNFVITEDMEDQAAKVCQMLSGSFGNRNQNDLFGNVQEVYHQNRGYLVEYNLTMDSLFDECIEDQYGTFPSMKRIDIMAKYRGVKVGFQELITKLEQDMEEQANLLSEKDRELFEDILANTVSKKIRARIYSSNNWVEKMNHLMESMKTSSGLKLSLKWKSKRAEKEEQLDTRTLVAMLQKDVEIMREEEVEILSKHFRSKIEEARKIADDSNSVQSFHSIMREVLDYRKWFEFQLEYQKSGEQKKELTDRVFFTFSGGEKAMAMYVPLFSAVVAKYAGARRDAPKIISLDEAFAGVDEMNIKDMFRLMVNFEFNFIINSQILWGDYETVPALAVYQLIRPENAKYVTIIKYVWNGLVRSLTDKIGDKVE